jgi:hypothetical protein
VAGAAVRQEQVKRMKRDDRSISWLEVMEVDNRCGGMRQVNASIEGGDERKRVGQRCRKGMILKGSVEEKGS